MVLADGRAFISSESPYFSEHAILKRTAVLVEKLRDDFLQCDSNGDRHGTASPERKLKPLCDLIREISEILGLHHVCSKDKQPNQHRELDAEVLE